MSIESKAAARKAAEEAEREKKRRPGLWLFVLIGMPVVFAAFFLIGNFSDWSDFESRVYPGFTASDRNAMADRVQQDFDEPILYITSEVSDETTAGTGLRYYEITYIVTTKSDENVYAYVFFKAMNSVGTHEAGSIELILRTVTDQYEKSDITEESYTVHERTEDSEPAPAEP